MKKTIVEAMTPNPHTIGSDQPLEAAKHLMAQHGFRHLPVLEGGKLVGIISDRDVKLAFAVDHASANRLKISDVCSGEVYSAAPTDSVKDVAASMAREGHGSTVVVDRGKVVGIFTTTDACKLLAALP